jgi:hypothetical protein
MTDACCAASADGHHCDCKPCGQCRRLFENAKRNITTEVQPNGSMLVSIQAHVEVITLHISVSPRRITVDPHVGEPCTVCGIVHNPLVEPPA